jgi:hypothetical protein
MSVRWEEKTKRGDWFRPSSVSSTKDPSDLVHSKGLDYSTITLHASATASSRVIDRPAAHAAANWQRRVDHARHRHWTPTRYELEEAEG